MKQWIKKEKSKKLLEKYCDDFSLQSEKRFKKIRKKTIKRSALVSKNIRDKIEKNNL